MVHWMKSKGGHGTACEKITHFQEFPTLFQVTITNQNYIMSGIYSAPLSAFEKHFGL